MKHRSAAVEAAYNSTNLKHFNMLKIGTSLRFTDNSFNVVFSGEEYIAEFPVMEIQLPTFNTIVNREMAVLNLSDVALEFESLLYYAGIGTPVWLYRGVYDADNQPLLNTQHVELMYKGYVDKTPRAEKDGQRFIAMTTTSPMHDLERSRPIVASKAWARSVDPTDTSFDHILSSKKSTELGWGKRQ
jgi:hypothetical protein